MLQQPPVSDTVKRPRPGFVAKCTCPTEPFEAIEKFFREVSLSVRYEHCDNFIEAVFSLGESEPEKLYEYLYFFQDLLELVEALHTMYLREELSAMEEAGFKPASFAKMYKAVQNKLNDNKEYPVYLSPGEWACPRAVIATFFNLYPLPVWKYVLHYMVQSTTGKQPILEQYFFTSSNLWEECLLLYKLIEAAWLIQVMELPEREE